MLDNIIGKMAKRVTIVTRDALKQEHKYHVRICTCEYKYKQCTSNKVSIMYMYMMCSSKHINLFIKLRRMKKYFYTISDPVTNVEETYRDIKYFCSLGIEKYKHFSLGII